MKRSLQDQANDPALWEILKRKFEKSFTSNTSCRDYDFYSQHHDDHQDDDAPPEGKKERKDTRHLHVQSLQKNKKVNYRETKLMNSLITFIRSHVIGERVHDFQLGIESYQIKVDLTTPIMTFPGIEAHESYSIVDKPTTDLIYLNIKDEKLVMYLVEIVKFCDATLEKLLNEVKLRIFQNYFWKKLPRLGELDLDIIGVFEREISKRLSH
ncbi:hypothetical protein Tco_1184154 [Tanacetum coccineum]